MILDDETIALLEADFEEKLEKEGLKKIDLKPNNYQPCNCYFKKIVEEEDLDLFVLELDKSDSFDTFIKNYSLKGNYQMYDLRSFLNVEGNRNNIYIEQLFLKRIEKYYPAIYDELIKSVKNKEHYYICYFIDLLQPLFRIQIINNKIFSTSKLKIFNEIQKMISFEQYILK